MGLFPEGELLQPVAGILLILKHLCGALEDPRHPHPAISLQRGDLFAARVAGLPGATGQLQFPQKSIGTETKFLGDHPNH